MSILEATGIKKRFGGVVALSNGNLKCESGRITGLLGANGSGKSTISKIITGVYSADAGEVRFKDKLVKYRSPNEARKDGMAMVFQNLSLVAELTVWQNVVLGAENLKGLLIDNKHAREKTSKIISQLMPELDIEKKVSELSPAELQIVEIAKALSSDPQLLILDEPTAALEQAQVKSLFNHMRQLAQKGVAMIFTSHRLWEVTEICDEITIFRNGENVGNIDFARDGKDAEKIVSLITGQATEGKTCRTCSEIKGETVLNIENMNLGRLLKNVSFELKRGEILGIGGLANQGQHELMLALAGNYSNIRGKATVNGKSIRLNKPATAIQNGICLVPGDRQLEGLFLNHAIFTNLIFPKLGLKRQPFVTPRKKYRQESADVIKVLSIKTPNMDIPVGNLSGGNQQKVVVGKWFSHDANVLLLADPAKGVDVGAKRDLYRFIGDLVKDKKTSVILYASDNEELIENCDRLLIMYEGQIVQSLQHDELTDEKIMAVSMRI